MKMFCVTLAAGLALALAAGVAAGTRRNLSVPGWGNPGGCYYGANSKCWVYSHSVDQGFTSCQVLDISADPGHTGPNTYTRSAATDIANIAVNEGYQWAGGCYDNNDRDPTRNAYP